MISLIEPFLDWEDAEHVVGALGGLVEIGVGIWNFFREKDEEKEGEGGLVVEKNDGTEVPLGKLLQDHEERLAKLERPARRKAKARARTA